jgi:hypothetical protein
VATWYTVDDGVAGAEERLLAAWIDAPTENTETCGYILGVARDQVWSFAPESETDEVDDDGEPVTAPVPLVDDDTVPDRLVYAQLKQAENLWNAGRVNSAGDVGADGGYSYTPRPLDKTIRGVIRPVKGVFSVG